MSLEMDGNGDVKGSGTKIGESGLRKGDFVATSSNSVVDWRGLFSASPNQALSYYPPQNLNGKIVIPQEVVDEGALHWENSVVAQFIGKTPNFNLFQRLVNILWGTDGEVSITLAGTKLFIIRFPNSIARDRVL